MTAWPRVALGDICEFKYGRSLPASSRQHGEVNVFGSNGVVGKHNERLTEAATIVIGRKGSFGEVNYSPSGCWPIDTTYYVDNTATKVDLSLNWLSYVLPSLRLKDLNRAAAIPGLNREDAYRRTLLLPPIVQQRRIAAILDHADALRAKRREALARLDDLTRSMFLDLFTGPESDLWPLVTVEAIAAPGRGSIRTGPFGSQLLHAEFVESGVAVLGIDNAVANEFRWGQRRFITDAKYLQLARYRVDPGDVLITIMGTCGRCAVVPEDIPTAINTKHLCCITTDRSICLPEFLHASFLSQPQSRAYLERTAKGAIMAGLNMAIIKAMPLVLPAIDVQRQFVRRLAAIGGVRTNVEVSADEGDALFRSLQSRAFEGKL